MRRILSFDETQPVSAATVPARTGLWSRPASRLLRFLSPGDWIYVDAHYLEAEVEVDPARAREWLPTQLKLADPPRASLFTAWFPINTFGSAYREAGVLLHVTHRGRPAVHCPWMIVDDDVALILGRELLGYPKKLGTVEFRVQGDRVVSRAERRGVELLRLDATLGERVASPPPMLGRPHRNVRATLGLSVPTVLAFTPREEPVEVRRAQVELAVGASDRDPISELGLGRVTRALLHRVNLAAGGLPVPCGLASPRWVLKTWLLRSH